MCLRRCLAPARPLPARRGAHSPAPGVTTRTVSSHCQMSPGGGRQNNPRLRPSGSPLVPSSPPEAEDAAEKKREAKLVGGPLGTQSVWRSSEGGRFETIAEGTGTGGPGGALRPGLCAAGVPTPGGFCLSFETTRQPKKCSMCKSQRAPNPSRSPNKCAACVGDEASVGGHSSRLGPGRAVQR